MCLSSFGPQTGYLINIRNLFPTILEVEQSKVKVLAWSDEHPLPGCRLLVVASRGGGGLRAPWSPFYEALIPFMKALPSDF